MCGIAGLIDFSAARPASANGKIAVAMSDAIRHRGPDGSGVWGNSAGVWLSHRRLAIVELSDAGAQPMATPDGAMVISYNGEIYNAADLKPELEAAGYMFRGHSDTEVLLYACHLWGPAKAVKRVIGMFAFACWDEREHKLTLVRDRLGKKPLYWFKTARSFAFASELRPLLLHPDCPADIDRSSVAEYLRFAYVPAPHSIFDHVRKLEPAKILTVHVPSGELATETYWDLRAEAERGIADPFPGSLDDALAETERLLLDATRIRMIADVPLGAFLSGGIDSSIVTAMMQEASAGKTRTFSIGSPSAEYDEAADAAKVAAHLGTEHTSFIVNPEDAFRVIPDMGQFFDEPFADASQVPTYLVSKLARQEVTVALTGDGGDEIFAGYNRHVAANGLLARLNRLPQPARSAMATAMTALPPDKWQRLFNAVPSRLRPRSAGEKLHKLAPLLRLDEAAQYRSLVSQWPEPREVAVSGAERRTAIDDPTLDADIPDPVARMRYLDLATYLPGDILTKVDRASMAVSLETRAPLLDHRLVEWSFRLPSSVHLHDGKGKWLLRKILEKRIPAALIDRPKTGFGLPIGEWLRGPLRPWAEALLDSGRLRELDLVREDAVRAVWKQHLSGEINAQSLIWPILMLVEWHAGMVDWRGNARSTALARAS